MSPRTLLRLGPGCLVLMLVACGGSAEPTDPDGSAGGDGASTDGSGDGNGSASTRVSGTLGGDSYVLTHAVVIFDEPLSTLCLSNVSITAPTCGLSDEQSKLVFFGKFGFNGDQPQWAFPQVELREVPVGVVELSTDGTLILDTFDPIAGTASGSLDLTFASGQCQGTFAVP